MDLNFIFNKLAGRWFAEFEATSDFNLHIEGVTESNVLIFQRGSGTGEYAQVKDAVLPSTNMKVYDCDFSAMVYPKYIKVSSVEQPTMAVVTMGA